MKTQHFAVVVLILAGCAAPMSPVDVVDGGGERSERAAAPAGERVEVRPTAFGAPASPMPRASVPTFTPTPRANTPPLVPPLATSLRSAPAAGSAYGDKVFAYDERVFAYDERVFAYDEKGGDEKGGGEEVSSERQPWEKWGVLVGGMLATVESSIRFGTTGAGVDVDLEDALGLDSSAGTARIEGLWRFTENRRHRLDLSWIRLHRSASRTVGEDIDIGDDTILAGSDVDSELDINLARLAYSYSLVLDERVDLALSGGFFVAPISASVSATGVGDVEGDFSITAPLPVFGLRTDILLTKNSYLRSRIDLFYIEIGDFKGVLRDVNLAYEYRPWEHFGLGIGIDSFGSRVEASGDSDVPGVSSEGRLGFDYTGVLLYLRGYF